MSPAPKRTPGTARKPQPDAPSLREPWKAFQVRHRNKDVKREAVIATAAHLFLEHGYRNTSLSMLAARLNITKPALYYYFRNKEEIVAECYREGIGVIDSHLKRSAPGPDAAKTSALERLRLYIAGYAHVVLTTDFGRCFAQIDDRELSPAIRGEVRKLKRRIDHSLRTLVEQGIAEGSISPCNPMLLSFAAAGAINWIGTWYQPSGTLSAQAISADYTHFLTSGLVAKARPKRRV